MAVEPTFTVNAAAQEKILSYAKTIMADRRASPIYGEMKNKMEIIDRAYARFTATKEEEEGNTTCGDVFASDAIVAPIVVSQVDAMVAYLADIFLSGYPMFPVVSNPKNRVNAEALETLLDDHATLGGYARQLLLMLKDGVKYNLSALEVDWSSIEQFSVISDFAEDKGRKLDKASKYYSKLKRLDLYNTVWDTAVAPGDLASDGDFAGYIEVISKTKLKRLTNKLSNEKKAMNITEALSSFKALTAYPAMDTNFAIHPQISKYVSPRSPKNGTDWGVYLGEAINVGKGVNLHDGSSFEKFVLYARILPSDFGIKAPSANTPQIWKFTIINMRVVVEATRIISAYDNLPILFGQPLEDGLGYQTQSVAEGAIPFQDGASTLYNIRFAAARRAVSDRALYLADMIDPSAVNSKAAAPKIPVRLPAMASMGLDSVYKQIPFDMRGTETTISDARAIVGFSGELTGLNGPQQGQFQKGNKSVQEWNDTIGGSDNRLRLPAMLYEFQVFMPLKQILALNVFQYGEDAKLVSQKTGEIVDIKIDELRREVLSFRIADGYSPKSKMASVEALTAGMNMIMNSPMLQQAYGAALPNVFAHMMQLSGVRGLEQYMPDVQQAPMNPNLQAASISGQPAPAVSPATNMQAPMAPSMPTA